MSGVSGAMSILRINLTSIVAYKGRPPPNISENLGVTELFPLKQSFPPDASNFR